VTVAVSPQGKALQVEVGGTRYTGSQTFSWQRGSTHTLKAVTPQSGNDGYSYTFDHWSDAGAETHTVTPQEDATYTVYYGGDNPNVTVTVAVSPQGKGLQVEVGGTRYTETQTFTWQKGSTHTLKAVTPQTGNDGYTYTFDRWSDGGAETHTVTPQEDVTYTV
jgi:membrane-bound inhibitor of C-type lysozyme